MTKAEIEWAGWRIKVNAKVRIGRLGKLGGPGSGGAPDGLAFRMANGAPLRGVCLYAPGGQGDYNVGQSFTADSTTNIITCASHGRQIGQSVKFHNTGGALPGGLSDGLLYTGPLYWVIASSFTTGQFKVSNTRGGSEVDITSNGSGTNTLSNYYNATPYDMSGSETMHTMNPDAKLDELLGYGFNHLRMSYNLGSVMQLIEGSQSTTTVINTILNDVTFAVNRGLKVVIDNHWSNVMSSNAYQDPVPGFSNRDCCDGVSGVGPKYTTYKAAIVALATALNGRIATLPPSMVALELCNEPPDAVNITGDTWEVQQPITYAAVRAVMPSHTIVLTSRQFSRANTMTSLNYSSYNRDPNVMFSFHPYDDQDFTLSTWGSGHQLTYPPDISQKAAFAAPTGYGVNAAYFDTPHNKAWIKSTWFDVLEAWRIAQGINANQLWAGEFGAGGADDSTGSASSLGAPNDTSRMQANKDVADLCEANGYGWNLFAMRTTTQDLAHRSAATWTTFLPHVTGLPGISL